MRTRDDLLAVVSHDLKNPLNVVSMVAGILQSEESTDDRGGRAAIDLLQPVSVQKGATLRWADGARFYFTLRRADRMDPEPRAPVATP